MIVLKVNFLNGIKVKYVRLQLSEFKKNQSKLGLIQILQARIYLYREALEWPIDDASIG
jgi:hypothetical protein